MQGGREVKEQLGAAPGVTVWAAICCDALFGPFFLPGHVTSELCPTILRKKFCLAISDCPDIQENGLKMMAPQRIMQTWFVSGCLTLLVFVG